MLAGTVLCKSNANEFHQNSWLFRAFQRNFAPHDISLTNRDSSPHFCGTYCLERPDLSSDVSPCTVVCCDLSRDNSLFVKVLKEKGRRLNIIVLLLYFLHFFSFKRAGSMTVGCLPIPECTMSSLGTPLTQLDTLCAYLETQPTH